MSTLSPAAASSVLIRLVARSGSGRNTRLLVTDIVTSGDRRPSAISVSREKVSALFAATSPLIGDSTGDLTTHTHSVLLFGR